MGTPGLAVSWWPVTRRFESRFPHLLYRSAWCCSVAKLCLILSDPMDCSTPDFPVLHCLIGVCSNSCPLSRWCHLILSSSVIPFSSCPQSFSVLGSFPVSWFFASGGSVIGASASASVLSMDSQGWSHLGLIDLISLLSRGLSDVFSSTTVWKHQFFSSQPSFTQQ